jgi:hypothetical protein
MSSLWDLTKHPIPDEITPELVSSVTISTLNKWIVEKGIEVENFRKAKRKDKEDAILQSLANNPEPNVHESSGNDDDDGIDAAVSNQNLDNVIDSAMLHIQKKMKTNAFDNAVRETILVSNVSTSYNNML